MPLCDNSITIVTMSVTMPTNWEVINWSYNTYCSYPYCSYMYYIIHTVATCTI